MQKKKLPTPTPKYQVFQATDWDTVFQVHKRSLHKRSISISVHKRSLHRSANPIIMAERTDASL